jgi:hypothetical protein
MGRRGIADKHPEILNELGTMPDTQLGRKYGVTNAAIGNLRRRFGVPVFSKNKEALAVRAASPMRRGQQSLENRFPEMIPLLGTMKDDALAEQFGVSYAAVGNLRRRLRIAFYSPAAARRKGTSKTADIDEAIRQLKYLEQNRQNYGDNTGQVIMVFRYVPPVEGSTEETYHVLHSFNGIRVYHRNALDPRITMGGVPPFFDNWEDCEAHLKEEPNGFRPALLDYGVARLVFMQQQFTKPLYEQGTGVDLDAEAKLKQAIASGKNVVLSPEEARSLLGF